VLYHHGTLRHRDDSQLDYLKNSRIPRLSRAFIEMGHAGSMRGVREEARSPYRRALRSKAHCRAVNPQAPLSAAVRPGPTRAGSVNSSASKRRALSGSGQGFVSYGSFDHVKPALTVGDALKRKKENPGLPFYRARFRAK